VNNKYEIYEARVRKFDAATMVATVVIPGVYGMEPIEAPPFIKTEFNPSTNSKSLSVGDRVLVVQGENEVPEWLGFVNITGDKMTGELVLSSVDPVNQYGAVSADYMNRSINSRARGLLAYQLGTANGFTLSAATWVPLYSLTVALSVGRCYELSWQNRAITSSTAQFIRYKVTVTPGTGSGIVMTDNSFFPLPASPANWASPYMSTLIIPTVSASYTFTPEVQLSSSGTLYDNVGGWCGLFDIGVAPV